MVVCPLFLGCCFSLLRAGCSFHHGSHCCAHTVIFFSYQVTGVRAAAGVCLVWCCGGCSVFISMCSYVLVNNIGLSRVRAQVKWKFEYEHLHASVSWFMSVIMMARNDNRYLFFLMCPSADHFQVTYSRVHRHRDTYKLICVFAWANSWEIMDFMRQLCFSSHNFTAKLPQGGLCYNTSVKSLLRLVTQFVCLTDYVMLISSTALKNELIKMQAETD